MLYETKFLVSLGATSLLEAPLYFLLIKYLLKLRKVGNTRIVAVSFLVSILTLPYLWFVFPPYINSRYYIYYGEGFVVVLEALLIFLLLGLRIDKAVGISLVTNAFSYFAGRYLIDLII